MLVPVEVASFAIDPSRNTPLVILKESGGSRSIAISIGPLEASAIAIKSLDVAPSRPLTIDLARVLMEELGGSLDKAVVYDFRDHTFYAHLHVVARNRAHVIDCRPSDALALALRCGRPILVDDAVFDKDQPNRHQSEKETVRQTIANLNTLDFGRYFLE
jgi:bifunctional DNase/RNase